jgi:hypothetical protein
MNLTNEQINFIIDNFFYIPDITARLITETLLINGSVIIGRDTIDYFVTSSVNFLIEKKIVENSYYCSQYFFDINKFLSSEYFKNKVDNLIKEKQNRLNQNEKEINLISELMSIK